MRRALILLALLVPATGSQAAPVVFRDTFRSYRAGSAPETGWDMVGGAFTVRGGALAFTGPGAGTAIPLASQDLGVQTVEVEVRPGRRLTGSAWAAAGVAIYADAGNHWRLALVESPAGDRYAELVEMHNGVWQAQQEALTRLPAETPAALRGAWTPDTPYRLRLALTARRVQGWVTDPSGAVIYTSAYRMPASTPAVRSGRIALVATELTAAFRSPTVASDAAPGARDRKGAKGYRVAVQGPGAPAFARGLRTAGIAASALAPGDLALPQLDRNRWDALAITDGARFPIRARANLLRFLRGGGDMLVIGGPMFTQSIRDEESARQKSLAALPGGRPLFDTERENFRKWLRSANDMSSPTHWAPEAPGPRGIRSALRVDIPNLTGWDTIGRTFTGPFAGGDNLTIFWARGDARTTALLVEWRETDGSRWIATVHLTQRWKRYVLTSDDFLYWRDSPTTNRGSGGDILHPDRAALLSIGIAQTHASVAGGPKTFWIADMRTGRLPAGLARPDFTPPTLETFSPEGKVYHLPSLHPTQTQLAKAAATGHQSGPVVVPVPRPRGMAFAGNRRGRWLPLESIRDDRGVVRGANRWLYVNLALPYRGSVWGGIAAVPAGQSAPAIAAGMLRRMRSGAFLAKAGLDRYSYFEGESAGGGAQAVNFGAGPLACDIQTRIVGARVSRPFVRRTITLPPGGMATATAPPAAAAGIASLRPGTYRAITEVRSAGRVIDRIEQPFSVLPAAPPPASAFVTVADGDFHAPIIARGGRLETGRAQRLWYPYGVNYWQSNVAGSDPADYWLHWLDPGYYDPGIVEADLAALRACGFNSVSIQLNSPDHVRQVNDFTARALRHGIRANLFIGGAHPFYVDEPLYTRLLRDGRFAINPAIWAYDIAWEHHLGPQDERRSWDREWEQWIIEQYGTVAHAEAVWGEPAPRGTDGAITNPPNPWLRADGPHLKLAVAYEHCADDIISRRYGKVIRSIRALDPNHLVSARSASQPSWSTWFAYDLLSSGKHFDFASPEGYGVLPQYAGMTTAYARWAGNGRPVFWAEFGSSIYPYDATGELERAQAAIHRGFAAMLLESGASGLASWWNVGGYRVDERSDFGIFGPDGTPRASALELRRLAAACTMPRSTRPPTKWVTVDRDLHAAAYNALYDAHRQAYADEARRGGMLGVRTEGTGTTSASCPLTAVSNLAFDGFMPLKHLRAEFNRVEIRDAGGVWRSAAHGDTVTVASGRPVMARVSAGNTGEARWLAAAPAGAVQLVGDDRADAWSRPMPRITFAQPIERDVPRYGDAEVPEFVLSPGIDRASDVVFTMEARGRARFGERRRIVLRLAAP